MAALSVFYGSQTGCAESIAQQIYSAAVEKQLDAQLLPLNEFQASKVADKPGHHVIIVCSTTGNGEPPDNAGKFWRYVKRRTQPKDMLANMSFTVLGLGDTNYDRFCYMGKSIDKRFAELGAQRYYALGVADEALGLEDFVEPWLEGLWAAFDKSSGASGEATSSSSDGEATSEGENVQVTSESETTTQQHVDLTQHLPANLISYESMFGPLTAPTQAPEELPRLQASVLAVRFADEPIASGPESTDSQEIGPSHPFLASVVSARYLTSSVSERKVLGVDLDLGESGITYKPGDSIGVKCPNRVEDVNVLLARLGLEGSKHVVIEMAAPTGRVTRRQASGANRFPVPVTVRELFEHHVDILSSPKKAVLRALATYCSNDEERAQLLVLSSKVGADKYQAFVADQQLTFLELLLLFPSCSPPLDHVLSLLPQLMARYYSVASSPLLNPRQLTIAFTVVENAVGPRAVLRRGLCTNWMKDMVQPLLNALLEASDIKFPIFPRPTEDFTLPASQEPPLLLIGPGTGVAPFIGFLQQRHHEVQNRVDDGSDASAPGDISLFFGCRRSTEDWIFRNEMESFVENGTLSKLVTAFSREQDEKHYVQHQLRANGDFVCELVLQSSGYVFVCGDGVAMARDVHAALVEILEEHGKMTKEDAEARLRELATSKRYIRDIW